MEQLGGLDGHGLLQHGVLLQIPLRQLLTLFIGVVEGLLKHFGTQAQDTHVCVGGRVLVHRPARGHMVPIQRHTVNNDVVEHFRILHGVGGPQELGGQWGELPLDGLVRVQNVLIGGVHPQMSRLVVAYPAHQHLVQLQQEGGNGVAPVVEPGRVGGVGPGNCLPVGQGDGLTVVVGGEDGRHVVDGLSVPPVTQEKLGNGIEDVLIDFNERPALQIPKQRPVQVRPLVHQIVPGKPLVRQEGFLRVFDIEHALGEIEVRPVGQGKPLHEAYLLTKPHLVHAVVVGPVQVGKGHAGLPPHPVLEVDGNLPLLDKGPGAGVPRVVVDGEGQGAVRLQEVQPGKFFELPTHSGEILEIALRRHRWHGGHFLSWYGSQ